MNPTTQRALDRLMKQIATYQPPKKSKSSKQLPKAKVGKK